MAQNGNESATSGPSSESPLAHGGISAPSAGGQGAVQDTGLSFAPFDSSGEPVIQPFPRSPKLLQRLAKAGRLTEEQLSRRVEELSVEQARAEAHIQSLKKRKADLSRSTERMKGQVRERFEAMQEALRRDQQAVQDSLDLDLKDASSRLDHVLQDWDQHLGRVSRALAGARKSLSHSRERDGEPQAHLENVSTKREDASEVGIRLNEERFEKLLTKLRSISKDLKAQLLRKTLLLDATPVMIDRQTSHSQLIVTAEGRGLCYSSSANPEPEHPLKFNKVCCALGSVAVTAGRSYWEADMRCCSAWAVGVAYGSLERRGRDKGAKLGRNRNSWCIELRDGRLSAWHNDRGLPCQLIGRGPPGMVGVWVNYEKGRVAFYDAEDMRVLTEFSAALTPVFDRAHHQFTEPLYPVIRLMRPPESQNWPNHMEICDSETL